jgi:hypothetical protein
MIKKCATGLRMCSAILCMRNTTPGHPGLRMCSAILCMRNTTPGHPGLRMCSAIHGAKKRNPGVYPGLKNKEADKLNCH